MLGSSASVSTPNIVLNTAVAEALAQFYEELKGTAPEDMEHAVHELIKRAIKKHKKLFSTETAIPKNGWKKRKNGDFTIWFPHRTASLPLLKKKISGSLQNTKSLPGKKFSPDMKFCWKTM